MIYLSSGADVIIKHDLYHNHEADISKLGRQSLSKRKAAEDICERPSKLINNVIGDSSYKENLTTNDITLVQRCMNRSRLKLLPVVPTNINEVHAAIKILQPTTNRQEDFVLDNNKKKMK